MDGCLAGQWNRRAEIIADGERVRSAKNKKGTACPFIDMPRPRGPADREGQLLRMMWAISPVATAIST